MWVIDYIFILLLKWVCIRIVKQIFIDTKNNKQLNNAFPGSLICSFPMLSY